MLEGGTVLAIVTLHCQESGPKTRAPNGIRTREPLITRNDASQCASENPPPPFPGSGSVTDWFCLPRGAPRRCLRRHYRASVCVRVCEDAEGRRAAVGPDPHFTFFTCPSAVCFLLESWGSPLASHLRNVTSHLFLVWYGGSLRPLRHKQSSLPHPLTGSVCGVTETVLLRADVRGGYGLGDCWECGQWYEWKSVWSEKTLNFICVIYICSGIFINLFYYCSKKIFVLLNSNLFPCV